MVFNVSVTLFLRFLRVCKLHDCETNQSPPPFLPKSFAFIVPSSLPPLIPPIFLSNTQGTMSHKSLYRCFFAWALFAIPATSWSNRPNGGNAPSARRMRLESIFSNSSGTQVAPRRNHLTRFPRPDVRAFLRDDLASGLPSEVYESPSPTVSPSATSALSDFENTPQRASGLASVPLPCASLLALFLRFTLQSARFPPEGEKPFWQVFMRSKCRFCIQKNSARIEKCKMSRVLAREFRFFETAFLPLFRLLKQNILF